MPHRSVALHWSASLVSAVAVSVFLAMTSRDSMGATSYRGGPESDHQPSLSRNLPSINRLYPAWLDRPHTKRTRSAMRNRVQAEIDYLTTTGRNELQLRFDRADAHLPLMQFLFRAEGLPEDLAYLALIESGFDHTAVSEADAVGTWQFTPSTAEQFGLRTDTWVDERRDLLKSTNAAARYLKGLYRRLGSWPLALASYNTGPTRVRQAMRGANSSDFWRFTTRHRIYRETREYVPRFIASVIIAQNRETFGFFRRAGVYPAYDEVLVGRSTDLHLLARYAGSTYEEIMALNPELRRQETPPDRYAYRMRLPKGERTVPVAAFTPLTDTWQVRWMRHHGIERRVHPTPPRVKNATVDATMQRSVVGAKMSSPPPAAIRSRQRGLGRETIQPGLHRQKKTARSHRAGTGRSETALLQRTLFCVSPADGRSLGGRD
jgi:hypothetical protein